LPYFSNNLAARQSTFPFWCKNYPMPKEDVVKVLR